MLSLTLQAKDERGKELPEADLAFLSQDAIAIQLETQNNDRYQKTIQNYPHNVQSADPVTP